MVGGVLAIRLGRRSDTSHQIGILTSRDVARATASGKELDDSCLFYSNAVGVLKVKELDLEEARRNGQAIAAFSGVQVKDEDLTMLDVLLILAQQKRFIVVFTCVCSMLALGISLILPKEYTATVTILPPQQSSSLGGTLAMQLSGLGSMGDLAGGALGIRNRNDMYVAMLKSRTVEDAVIHRFGLMREYRKKYDIDARKALEHHTEINGSTKDGLIRLSFESKTPTRAASIANGYVEQFRELSEHLAITEAAQRRLVFEQQLAKTNSDLANAEEALKATQLSTGMVQLDAQSRAFIESAARLRAQVTAKEVQIQAMRTYAGDDNPALIEAQRELDGLKDQFTKLVGSQSSGSDDLFLPKGQIPQAGLEYIRRLRDVKYYEAIFDILARQLELAKLDEAKEGGFIQVVDPAVPPGRKSFPKRLLITAAAAAVGLSLAVIIVLFQAGLNRISMDPEKGEKLRRLYDAIGIRRSSLRRERRRESRRRQREEDHATRAL